MKKKKGLWIFLIAVAVIVVFVAGTKLILEKGLKDLTNMQIHDVDLSQVADGVYTGSCKAFPVEAVVEVTVKGHVITKINLIKHVNGQGGAAEILPAKVVENQTLELDAVSGATYSSKAILKAIENALTSTK